MGREIRRVPPHYEHPKNEKGYIPLYKQNYVEASEEWVKEFKEFKPDDYCKYYWEYAGNPPDAEAHVEYGIDEATWYQVFETVSEGTPVTPPFETKEELAEYLSKHGDFWDQKRGDGPWEIENAKEFVGLGWAPSMMISESGVMTAPRDGAFKHSSDRNMLDGEVHFIDKDGNILGKIVNLEKGEY